MAAAADTAVDGRQRRRAIPIIDSRFQWKYTLLVMALGVGVMAVMGGLLYKAHLENTRIMDLDGNRFLQEQLIRGEQIFLLYLILCVVAMAIVLAIWGLIVTHRVSGPLYVVARHLGVLADGQYPDVRPLRKRDELQEFFMAFDEAVSSLRDRDRNMVREIEEALADAKKALDGDAKGGLESVMKTLEVQQRRLNSYLRPD